jgi:hypothetical protein
LAAFFMQWQLHQFDVLKFLSTKHEYLLISNNLLLSFMIVH